MAEKIVEKNSTEQFKDDYTRYGIYVMYRRVLSDFRDGLKPVQRRIVYAMLKDTKCTSPGTTVKSAAVVGDVMKSYHPHGDASIYDTIKPMTNWFEINIPLIIGDGNFGTFQGDGPAASRYTECYLSNFTMEVIVKDLIDTNESVDWEENYDRRKMEPEYLPCAVPLLLINGSFGIGLGMKAEIPSHNINEVIDATLSLIYNPNAEVVLVPDHCMPCYIFNTDFDKISRMGFGKYKIRGIIDKETIYGKNALVIKSIPDLTYLNNITDKIEELVASKKIIQIDNCYDDSKHTQLRYVIMLKSGADPEYVKEVIYKNTEMEQLSRINFITLDGLNPMRMSYKSYLQAFIEFRKLTKFRVYMNQFQKVQTRIHERDAYIKVLESGEIDNIINMIKKQKSIDDNYLVEYLIKRLNITDLQAGYIIGTDLRKLSYGYLTKYKQEAIELEKEKAILMNKITNDNLIIQDIVNELNYFKNKYGKPRKCKIVNDNGETDIPKGEMKVVITERNYIKKVPINNSIGIFKGDSPKKIIRVDNTENILVFDDMGKVYKFPVHKIPFSDKVSNGTDIRFVVKGLLSNINTLIPESIIKRLDQQCGDPSNPEYFIITLTKQGLIKKMDLGDFTTIPLSGIIYCKVDTDDAVKDVIIANKNLDVIIYSDKKAARMNVSEIPYLKRNTKGSRCLNSSEEIDGMCLINHTSTSLLVVTESGKINKVEVSMVPLKQHSRTGFNIVKLGKDDKIKSILAVSDIETLKVTTLNTIYEFRVADIPHGSTISTGEKRIPIKGDKIMRVETYINR